MPVHWPFSRHFLSFDPTRNKPLLQLYLTVKLKSKLFPVLEAPGGTPGSPHEVSAVVTKKRSWNCHEDASKTWQTTEEYERRQMCRTYCLCYRLEFFHSTSHLVGKPVWLSLAFCSQRSTHTWFHYAHSTYPQEGRLVRTQEHWDLGIQPLEDTRSWVTVWCRAGLKQTQKDLCHNSHLHLCGLCTLGVGFHMPFSWHMRVRTG